MTSYSMLILYTLGGGIVSLIGGALLMSREKTAAALAEYATPFAAGALLSAVFLDLLPEGLEAASSTSVLTAALVGCIVFFFAERFLRWFHHHHQHGADPAVGLIIVGNGMHNLLDGVAIAAGFLVSPQTGIVTTIAIVAHEIPHEIGDFGLLLHKGVSRLRVLIINIATAVGATIVAVGTFAIGSEERLPVGVLVGLSAGFLLYIAMSDIIPEIHERSPKKSLWDAQPILLLVGAVVVGVVIKVAHHFLES